MRSTLRGLLIRRLLPWSWRRSPDRIARTLHRFALVEADSAWQLLRAAEALGDPRAQAALFDDAIEETLHARGFADLATRNASRPLPLPREARVELLSGDDRLGEFLGYLFVAERDVHDEFESYARAAGLSDVRAHLEAIRRDEARHFADAETTGIALTGSRERFDALKRRARRRRLRESLGRAAQAIADASTSLTLAAAYLLLAPFLVGRARRKLGMTGPRAGRTFVATREAPTAR